MTLGYLEKRPNKNNMGSGDYCLSLEGWKRVDDINKKQVESSQAFVAMWFDKEMDAAWKEGFEPALKKTGYKPIRADLVEHNEKICDRIIADIQKSGLLIADLTGNNQGVYYEAGFAQGRDMDVIWTCKKEFHEKEKLHFDIRQYSHILWENPKDLKKRLIKRIEDTLPNRVRKQEVE